MGIIAFQNVICYLNHLLFAVRALIQSDNIIGLSVVAGVMPADDPGVPVIWL